MIGAASGMGRGVADIADAVDRTAREARPDAQIIGLDRDPGYLAGSTPPPPAT